MSVPADTAVAGSGPSSRGVALLRPPAPVLADGIVTHVERQPVDVELARSQHHAYAAALTAAGWTVIDVGGGDSHPDSVFIEDTVVVVDDLAVLTRPGAPARRDEVEGTRVAVAALGLRVVQIEAGTLDGGDVLQVGRTGYVGRGGRTDGEGIRALRRHLEPLGRVVVPVPLRAVLHLKSAVTALPDGSIIGYAPLVDDPQFFPRFVPVPEESGAHVVLLGGGKFLMAADCPRSADLFADLGYTPITVDISEFEKLEGCVTCLSVRIRGMER